MSGDRTEEAGRRQRVIRVWYFRNPFGLRAPLHDAVPLTPVEIAADAARVAALYAALFVQPTDQQVQLFCRQKDRWAAMAPLAERSAVAFEAGRWMRLYAPGPLTPLPEPEARALLKRYWSGVTLEDYERAQATKRVK